MNIEGECVFSVSSSDLDVDRIEKLLEMQATKIVKKGEKIVTNRYAPKSIWMYERRIDENMCFEETLKSMLEDLYFKKKKVFELLSIYEVELNCYLRSELGQLGYTIDQEMMIMMREINIPIHFHILSFGLAE